MAERKPFIPQRPGVRGIGNVPISTPSNFLQALSQGTAALAAQQHEKAQQINVQEAKTAGEQAGTNGTPELSQRMTQAGQVFNEAARNSFNDRNQIEAKIEMENLEVEFENDPGAYQAAATESIERRLQGMNDIDPQFADILSKTLTIDAVRTASRLGKTQVRRMNQERAAEVQTVKNDLMKKAIELGVSLGNNVDPLSQEAASNAGILLEYGQARDRLDTTLHGIDYSGNTLTNDQISLVKQDFDDSFFGTAFETLLVNMDAQSAFEALSNQSFEVNVGGEMINPFDVLSATTYQNLTVKADRVARSQRAEATRNREEQSFEQKNTVRDLLSNASVTGEVSTSFDELVSLNVSPGEAKGIMAEMSIQQELFTLKNSLESSPAGIVDGGGLLNIEDAAESNNSRRLFVTQEETLANRRVEMDKDPSKYIGRVFFDRLSQFSPDSAEFYAEQDALYRSLDGEGKGLPFPLTIDEAKRRVEGINITDVEQLGPALDQVTGRGRLPDELVGRIHSQLNANGGLPDGVYMLSNAPSGNARDAMVQTMGVDLVDIDKRLSDNVSVAVLDAELNRELTEVFNDFPLGNEATKDRVFNTLRPVVHRYSSMFSKDEVSSAKDVIEDLVSSQYESFSVPGSDRKVLMEKQLGVDPKPLQKYINNPAQWVEANAGRFVLPQSLSLTEEGVDTELVVGQRFTQEQFEKSLMRTARFGTSKDFDGVLLFMGDSISPIRVRRNVEADFIQQDPNGRRVNLPEPGATTEPFLIRFQEMEGTARSLGIFGSAVPGKDISRRTFGGPF